MRGLAIIGIFLHNYCHWLGLAVKENEYTFTMANCRRLLEVMARPDINLPVHLLSFFGHYGVPVFLFLSAYGLVMKYEGSPRVPGQAQSGGLSATPGGAGAAGGTAAQSGKAAHGDKAVHGGKAAQGGRTAQGGRNANHSPMAFLRYHFLKLFKMMVVGFVAFTMVDAITPGRWHYTPLTIIAQLGMFNNVMPDPDHVIWPGPFWFFGLMLQLYIVYRLLLFRRGWKPVAVLVAVCWLMQIFCDPEGETLNRVRYNFMGGMMPFAFGLLFARYGRELRHGAWVMVTVVSALAVFFFSFNYQLWLWAPLFVCTFSLGLVKVLPQSFNEQMAWVGSISAALFIMHPVTRKVFIPISRGGDVYTGLLLYVIASIALAWLCRELMKKIPNPHLKVKR